MTGPPELHGRLSVSDTWSMWHVAEMSNWVFVLAASESLSLITWEIHTVCTKGCSLTACECMALSEVLPDDSGGIALSQTLSNTRWTQ